MSSDGKVTMTGDASQLLAEYKKENDAVDKKIAKLAEMRKESKKAHDEEKRMDAEALKVKEGLLTKQDKLNAEVSKLKGLLTANKISVQEYNKAFAQLASTSDAVLEKQKALAAKQAELLKKQTEAKAKAHEAEKKMDSEAAKVKDGLLTKQERQNASLAKLKTLLDAGKISQVDFNKAANDLGDTSESVFAKFGTGVAGVASSLIGVSAVVASIKDEYDQMLRRQEEARQTGLTFGDAVRDAAFNFRDDETMKTADLEPTIARIALSTGTDAKIVAATLGSAFSASGTTNAVAASVVEQAFRYSPNNQEKGLSLSSRALDLSKVIKSEDIKGILGFLTEAQSASRVADVSMLGKHGVPAMVASMSAGDTLEQAGELYATLNQAMQDAEGANSKTATISLASQLKEFVPKLAGKDEKGGIAITQESIDRFSAATSTRERRDAIRQDPEMQRMFLEEKSFEREAGASIAAWLAGTPTMLATEQTVGGKIKPFGPDSAASFDNEVARLNSLKSQALTEADRKSKANLEGARLADTEGARMGQVLEIIDKTLAGINLEGPDAVAGFGWGMAATARNARTGETPEASGIEIIKSLKDKVYPDDKRSLELLEQQLDVLRQMQQRNQGAPPEAKLGKGNNN